MNPYPNFMQNRLVRITALALLAAISLIGCSQREESATSSDAEASVGPMMHAVTSEEFNEMVLASPVPVLVDFWAPWCPPCRKMTPILKEMAVVMDGTLRIVKVNTDDAPALAERFHIRALPTLLLVRNGKTVAMQEGAMNKAPLQEWIQQQLGIAGASTNAPVL